MLKKILASLFVVVVTLSSVNLVSAEEVSFSSVMTPKESIKMDFNDGSKHFVLMVHREGKVEGSGPFTGADASEYGWHDINPPVGADPHGYFQFKTKKGDVANIKYTVRAVFFKGKDKPQLVDNGFWELVSGTGEFKGMTGSGTISIKPASEKDRLFSFQGELGLRP